MADLEQQEVSTELCAHNKSVEDWCYECHRLYGDPEWAWLAGLYD